MDWLTDKFVRRLKAPNGKSYISLLKSEAAKLVNMIQEHMNQSYHSYTPVVSTIRTGYMLSRPFFKLGSNIRIEGTKIYIDIIMEPAYHSSMFGADQVNVIKLLNWGYKVKKNVPFKNVEHFGWRKGYQFIESAVDEFSSGNPYGIIVDMSSINVKDYYN